MTTRFARMQKKCIQTFVALLLVGLMLFQPLASVAARDFAGHWAESYITLLTDMGIVTGDEHGNTNPENNITRAEFIAVIVRTFGLTAGGNVSANFPDVASGRWYHTNFAIARYHGIITGDDRGHANPSNDITRLEATVILARALDATLTGATTSFTDNDAIPPWGRASVAAMTEQEIITGFPGGYFRPQQNLTRAEGFALIARIINRNLIPDRPVAVGLVQPPPIVTVPPIEDPPEPTTAPPPVTTAPSTAPPATTTTAAPTTTTTGSTDTGAGSPPTATTAPPVATTTAPSVVTTAPPATTPAVTTTPAAATTPPPAPTLPPGSNATLLNYFNVGIQNIGGVAFIILEPIGSLPPIHRFFILATEHDAIWNNVVTVNGVQQFRFAIEGDYNHESQLGLVTTN